MTEDDAIAREASAWVECMTRPAVDAAQSAAFDRWMAADEEHAAAFARRLAFWDGREMAAALAMPDDIAQPDDRVAVSPRATGRLRYLVAAASIVLTFAAVIRFAPAFETRSYHSDPGRSERVTLADGTRIDLAPGSMLSVRMLPWARRATLVRGEAYFDVRHERWRSFTVGGDGFSVEDLGTAFNVDLEGRGQIEVQVYRGAVRFSTAGLDGAVLRAGFAGRLDDQDVRITPFDAARSKPDWQDGWFDADNVPLRIVIEKANRSISRPIIVRDSQDLQKRVSGRFKISDRNSLIEALRYAFDIRVS